MLLLYRFAPTPSLAWIWGLPTPTQMRTLTQVGWRTTSRRVQMETSSHLGKPLSRSSQLTFAGITAPVYSTSKIHVSKLNKLLNFIYFLLWDRGSSDTGKDIWKIAKHVQEIKCNHSMQEMCTKGKMAILQNQRTVDIFWKIMLLYLTPVLKANKMAFNILTSRN